MGTQKSKVEIKEVDPFVFASGGVPKLYEGEKDVCNIRVIGNDMALVLRSVSRVIHSYIRQGNRQKTSEATQAYNEQKLLKKKWCTSILTPSSEFLPIFSFDQVLLKPRYPTPSVNEVCDFIKPAFEKLYVQHECLLMMLIYIERIRKIGIVLNPETWRPLVYSALILASKIWEDAYISNKDFAHVYPLYPLKTTNNLERCFNNDLDWKLYISPEEYSNYYFQIKAMVDSHHRTIKRRFSYNDNKY